MNNLTVLLDQLVTKIPHSEQLKPAVSAAPAGWHIEHIVLTAKSIISAVKKSDPGQYQRTFNIKRIVVFATGKIPRGKGKAPEAVKPSGTTTPADFAPQIALLEEKLKDLDTLSVNHYFEHPYFGHLNLKATKRMLQIHTNHHLRIIHDIIGA